MSRKLKKSAEVGPLHKRVLYTATSLLWLTGAAWLVLYKPGSSSASSLMKLHGGLAMIFILVFGAMLFEHVPAGWIQHEHQSSGVWVIVAGLILIVTGWGLYYIGGERLRELTHWAHVIPGLALPLLIYLHVQVKRRQRGPSPTLEPLHTHVKK